MAKKHTFKLVKARPVAPGSLIGVFAPSSAAESQAVANGVQELEKRGFRVKASQDLTKVNYECEHGFSCGPSAERAGALMELVEDDEVSAIIAVRGGYGALDLLPQLDFKKIADARKLIIGYSDVTALLLAITQSTGLATIHGPAVAVEFAEASESSSAKESVDALVLTLTSPSYRAKLKGTLLKEASAGAECEGPIIAANLSMFTSLLGTPWEPECRGAVLVLEDIGEAPYRVQRALTQLLLARKFDELAGLVFGRFGRRESQISGPSVEGPALSDVLSSFVRDSLKETAFPVLSQIAVGHSGMNFPLPQGCKAKVQNNELQLLEAAIQA